jgi:hypothetical protein
MVQVVNTGDINKLIAETEKSLRDSAYILVGLGVLSFQQAQVRRRELAKQFGPDSTLAAQVTETAEKVSAQLSGLGERVVADLGSSREQFSGLAKTIDEKVAPTRAQIDQQIDAFEERLPASARTVFSTVRAAMKTPEATLRNVVGLD